MLANLKIRSFTEARGLCAPAPWALLLVFLGGGCAPLNISTRNPPSLPPMPKARDSVDLDLTFVRMQDEQESEMENRHTAHEEIWASVDEQQFSAETRRQWFANGLRCGLVGKHLPALLQKNIEEPIDQVTESGASADAEAVTSSHIQRHMRFRAGQRGEIVTSGTHDELVVLMKEGDRLRGETLTQAQCRLAVRAYPLDDGRVRVELTPEIHHGEQKQRYVGGDGMYRLEVGQQVKVFRELSLTAVLSPGQALLLDGTPEIKGLGRHFFSEGDGSKRQRKLLLIRLAESPANDLFEPQLKTEPLVTPWE